MTNSIGVVLIGRNEGERLLAALDAVRGLALPFVYVDSGSTDGSVAAALDRGGQVVNLDLSRKFTAARARNEGFEALLRSHPHLAFVQFIDGDCTLDPGWIAAGLDHVLRHDDVAIVCGRRREKYPEHSVYNRLLDCEWDGPVGEINECGGDILVRVEAFRSVSGYDPELIAGEEPDLCVRLRSKGWRIWRLQREMTLHDANVTRFSQWWKRTIRNGHAYGEIGWRYRLTATPLWSRQVRSVLVWGLAIPLAILLLALAFGPVWLALLILYPLQTARIALRDRAHGKPPIYAAFVVIAKFPEAIGVIRFHVERLLGRQSKLIEYK